MVDSGRYFGVVSLADTPRPESQSVISQLHEAGLRVWLRRMGTFFSEGEREREYHLRTLAMLLFESVHSSVSRFLPPQPFFSKIIKYVV